MTSLLRELPFFHMTSRDLYLEFNKISDKHDDIISNTGLRNYLYDLSKCDVFHNLNFDYYTDIKFNNYIRNLKRRVEISVFHVNINSLNAHNNDLLSYLECLTLKFDVIVLSEIWSYNIDLYSNLFPGFTFFHDLPPVSNIGGIGMFVREDLNPCMRVDLKIKNHDHLKTENLWLEVSSASKVKYVIGGIYRHPNQSIQMFNDALSDVFDMLNGKRCIVIGDINIDLLKYDSHSHTTEYINTLLLYNMLPTVLLPTRVNNRSCTLIDHIYTNCHASTDKWTLKSGNLVTDFTDHLSNFLLVIAENEIKLNQRPLIRIISPKNINNFRNDLENCDWETLICTITNPNEAYNKFAEILKRVFDENFPLVRLSRRAFKDKKWMTSGLKKSCNKKNKLYFKWITSKRKEDERNYKVYKNIFVTLIRQAESDYFKLLFDTNANDIKTLWKNLNNICNPKTNNSKSGPSKIKINNSETCKSEDIANYFNEYFVNIGADLSARLPQCSSNNNFYHFMPCSVSQSIFCEDISTDELFQTIAHLKNKKSSGPDNISTFILKQCSDILTSPLLHIFNSSLSEGEFPNQLKVAKVVPIFKNGDAMLVSNYRPISLLNVLSKILERLVYKRVLDFLNKNDILYKYQFGFRTGFSTSLALMEVTDMIYDCLDNNLLVLGLFLDLKKAF